MTEKQYEKKIARLERKLEIANNRVEVMESNVIQMDKKKSDAEYKFRELTKTFKVEPKDSWYYMYLLQSNAELERLHEEQEDTLKSYRDHFRKFESVYTDKAMV